MWRIGGLLAIGCLVLAFVVPWTVSARTVSDQAEDRVQAALPQLEKLAQDVVQQQLVPGMAIAVVHNDKVVYLKGFGVREMGKKDAVTADTVFQIASMSKSVGATVVAALVSEGVVSWDDRIIDHDPGFAMFDPWVTREVTIRDMYSHRSGLPGDAGNQLESIGYDQAAIMTRLRLLKPSSSFRSGYAYSNFGMTEGGLAAARAAGKPWPDVSADKLYRPLGMTSTSSRFVDYAAARNRALLHVPVDGQWTARLTRNPDAQSPAGGVSSTARDLAQWVRLILGNGKLDGKQLIAADALAETHRPHIMRGVNPDTGRPAFYGLGWNIDYDTKGRIFWGHAGAFSVGARTVVNLLPAENLGIVVLTNAFPSGVPEGIAASFYDLVLEGKVQQDWVKVWNDRFYNGLVKPELDAAAAYAKPPASAAPALPAAAYTGRYSNEYFGPLDVVEQDGGLSLQLGPQRVTFPLQHWDRDVFIYHPYAEQPEVVTPVMFVIGPDGKGRQVMIEDLDSVGQGTFTRAAAKP